MSRLMCALRVWAAEWLHRLAARIEPDEVAFAICCGGAGVHQSPHVMLLNPTDWETIDLRDDPDARYFFGRDPVRTPL